MKYYYSDGNSGAQGPYSREELLEFFKEGVISENCKVIAEGAEDTQPISILLQEVESPEEAPPVKHQIQSRMVLPAPVAPAAPTRIPVNGHAAREYLKRVRADSCYSTLRSVITILTVLSALSLLASASALAAGTDRFDGSPKAGEIIVAIAAAVFGVILIVACRQAALVLIDLADTQIERNSRQ